jgi:pilus assembly protein Flp/PilA
MLYRPRNEEGQGLVEYALILVLVAVVVIVILALLGPTIGNIFSNVVKGLQGGN